MGKTVLMRHPRKGYMRVTYAEAEVLAKRGWIEHPPTDPNRTLRARHEAVAT